MCAYSLLYIIINDPLRMAVTQGNPKEDSFHSLHFRFSLYCLQIRSPKIRFLEGRLLTNCSFFSDPVALLSVLSSVLGAAVHPFLFCFLALYGLILVI